MTDHQFYSQIWNEREHYCSNCGRHLGEMMQAAFCSHILPKGKYPKLRHVSENIEVNGNG